MMDTSLINMATLTPCMLSCSLVREHKVVFPNWLHTAQVDCTELLFAKAKTWHFWRSCAFQPVTMPNRSGIICLHSEEPDRTLAFLIVPMVLAMSQIASLCSLRRSLLTPQICLQNRSQHCSVCFLPFICTFVLSCQ